MRYIQAVILFNIMLIFYSIAIHAQENEIGINVGCGRSYVGTSQAYFMFPFRKQRYTYYRLGVSYRYTPKKAAASLETGINYDKRSQENNTFNYFKVPVGLNFQLGNKVQLVFGGGGLLSYLIAYDEDVILPSSMEVSKTKFQVGIQGNIGVAYKLNEKYNLKLIYQNNFDITPLEKIKDSNTAYGPTGTTYTKKGTNGLLQLSFCIKIE